MLKRFKFKSIGLIVVNWWYKLIKNICVVLEINILAMNLPAICTTNVGNAKNLAHMKHVIYHTKVFFSISKKFVVFAHKLRLIMWWWPSHSWHSTPPNILAFPVSPCHVGSTLITSCPCLKKKFKIVQNHLQTDLKKWFFCSCIIWIRYPITLHKKAGRWKLCINYWKFNKIIVKNCYFSLSIWELQNYFHRTKILTKMDFYTNQRKDGKQYFELKIDISNIKSSFLN